MSGAIAAHLAPAILQLCNFQAECLTSFWRVAESAVLDVLLLVNEFFSAIRVVGPFEDGVTTVGEFDFDEVNVLSVFRSKSARVDEYPSITRCIFAFNRFVHDVRLCS